MRTVELVIATKLATNYKTCRKQELAKDNVNQQTLSVGY